MEKLTAFAKTNHINKMKQIILVAVISGIISSAIVFYLMSDVPSAWYLFLIPLIMGFSIQKFGRIPVQEVEKDEKLEKKVGRICAGAVLFFIILTIIPSLIIYISQQGLGWDLLLNIPFLIVCGFAVWFGYNRGVKAVIDSYYDSSLKERDNQ